VKVQGVGKVKKQSLAAGQNLVKNTTILLELS
jgi:cell division protein FtsI (penicillin-binding protein 3)